MKRKITFLIAVLMLLTMMFQPMCSLADTAGYTPSAALSSTTGSVTGTAGETWSYSITWHENSYYGYGSTYGWQIGAGDSGGHKRGCKAFSISTSDITGTITQIEVEAGSYQANSKINVTVGGADFGTQNQSTYSGQGALKSTFTGSASGTIVISATDAVRAFYLKSITVTYAVGSTKTITFDGNGGIYSEATTYTQTVPESTATALTANKFTYEGNAFLGWSTVRDGDVVYSDKASITTSVDVILYAKWRPLTIYTLVTTNDSLVPGKHYIIASSKTVGGSRYIMDAQNGTKYRELHEVTIKSKIVDAKTVKYIEEFAGIYEFVLSGDNTNGWTIYDNKQDTKKYLYANGGTSNNYISITDNISTTGAKWSINITASQNAEIIANNTDYGAKNTLRYNSGSTRFSCYSSGQSPVYLFVKDGDTQIEFHSNTNIGTNVTVGQNLTLTNAITIEDDGILDMGNNTLSIGTGGSLTIEDGGQLITNSSVALTYNKNITAASKDANWYTIATPVHYKQDATDTDSIRVSDVTNLILDKDSYDFFYYDEYNSTLGGAYWMNYKASHPGFPFKVGQGFLYRNDGSKLSFAGTSNSAASYTYSLKYTGAAGDLAGINLIGNPYPHNITMDYVTVGDGTLAGGYVLSESDGWAAEVATTIAPTQGFLVQISTSGQTATIHKSEPDLGKSRANRDYIKFIVNNSHYEDATFALFDKCDGLNKIDHRNADIPMIYIPQDGQNFAIATMSDETQSFNLNFKAKTTGKYTLSYQTKGNYSYLHVIDRLTGEDIDMLLDGEYSFIASPQDNAARFIVKLSYNANGNNTNENDIFAFQSGSDIIVNGEGELQVFDVTGRQVMNTTINGMESINIPAQGVYIFRLNEKVQKIVVR